MNYFRLNEDSELTATLQQIHKALANGSETVTFAGREVKVTTSRKGAEYFSFEAGIPLKVLVFKSARGDGHMTLLELSLSATEDLGTAGRLRRAVKVRGMLKEDKKGRVQSFFFDPREEGEQRGRLMAKLELVQKGLLTADKAFTREEIDIGRKSGAFDSETVQELEKQLVEAEA